MTTRNDPPSPSDKEVGEGTSTRVSIDSKEASIAISSVAAKLYSEAEKLREMGLKTDSLFNLSRDLRVISDSI